MPAIISHRPGSQDAMSCMTVRALPQQPVAQVGHWVPIDAKLKRFTALTSAAENGRIEQFAMRERSRGLWGAHTNSAHGIVTTG